MKKPTYWDLVFPRVLFETSNQKPSKLVFQYKNKLAKAPRCWQERFPEKDWSLLTEKEKAHEIASHTQFMKSRGTLSKPLDWTGSVEAWKLLTIHEQEEEWLRHPSSQGKARLNQCRSSAYAAMRHVANANEAFDDLRKQLGHPPMEMVAGLIWGVGETNASGGRLQTSLKIKQQPDLLIYGKSKEKINLMSSYMFKASDDRQHAKFSKRFNVKLFHSFQELESFENAYKMERMGQPRKGSKRTMEDVTDEFPSYNQPMIIG